MWGADFLARNQLVFRLWHLFREGTIDRAMLQAAMAPIQAAVHALLEAGSRRCDAPEGMCQELLAHAAALWTFVREDGVEPTGYPLGERGRTGPPTGGPVAEGLFWRAQRRWESVCRAHPACACPRSTAATASLDLCHRGDHRILGRTTGAHIASRDSAKRPMNDCH